MSFLNYRGIPLRDPKLLGKLLGSSFMSFVLLVQLRALKELLTLTAEQSFYRGKKSSEAAMDAADSFPDDQITKDSITALMNAVKEYLFWLSRTNRCKRACRKLTVLHCAVSLELDSLAEKEAQVAV